MSVLIIVKKTLILGVGPERITCKQTYQLKMTKIESMMAISVTFLILKANTSKKKQFK
jgi:hypothetical protein